MLLRAHVNFYAAGTLMTNDDASQAEMPTKVIFWGCALQTDARKSLRT